MSSRQWVFRIQDILKAIRKIERYVDGMTLTKFKQNELVVDAVVRNFEVIGEASKSVPPTVQRSYPDVPWKEMKGMRDVLIHEYFGVDIKILWHTTKKDLSILRKQLERLLQNTEDDLCIWLGDFLRSYRYADRSFWDSFFWKINFNSFAVRTVSKLHIG